jgi:hypothetical protein
MVTMSPGDIQEYESDNQRLTMTVLECEKELKGSFIKYECEKLNCVILRTVCSLSSYVSDVSKFDIEIRRFFYLSVKTSMDNCLSL